LLAELGDFEVKIKDIINEAGFFAGLGKALTPKVIQTAMSGQPYDPSEAELAKSAYEKFGKSPDYNEKKSAELLARTTDPARRKRIQDLLGQQSWALDQRNIKKKDALKQQIKTASTSTPSVAVPLHPDVSVTSSYPLRLRYKNGDFVLDPKTNQWMTVSGKSVASTMSSFLQSQANKL
jgi:hypothetical protein